MSIPLTVQNLSTKVTDTQMNQMVAGLSGLLTTFCNDWSIKPVKIVCINMNQKPATKLCVYLMDTPDVNTALGYHDEKNGMPYGKVFVDPILSNGGAVLLGSPNANVPTVAQTLSHEIFELLYNPYCNSWWNMPNTTSLVAAEVSDPVQSNIVRVLVGNTSIGYSDWILPSWSDPQATLGPFNHLNTLTAPFTMAKGGYLIKMSAGKVTNVFGAEVESWVQKLVLKTSRLTTRLAGTTAVPATTSN